ncbi:hypothetical protein GCM10009628_27830 [Paeniglutamicibacter kerguelensis]
MLIPSNGTACLPPRRTSFALESRGESMFKCDPDDALSAAMADHDTLPPRHEPTPEPPPGPPPGPEPVYPTSPPLEPDPGLPPGYPPAPAPDPEPAPW